jgi:hypothetical protein
MEQQPNDILARELADARRCLALAIRENMPMDIVEYWVDIIMALEEE